MQVWKAHSGVVVGPVIRCLSSSDFPERVDSGRLPRRRGWRRFGNLCFWALGKFESFPELARKHLGVSETI